MIYNIESDIKMNPKVSVIIPVYNVEPYLNQCLDSVVNQTYKNLEIICVNDGSTDGSLKILESYANKDERIKIVSKRNEGLSSARNTAHNWVSGKYIMYLDSDDWIDVRTCEVAVRKAEEYNSDIIFWSYTREFDECSLEKHIYDQDQIIFSEKKELMALHRRFIGLYESELKKPEKADAIITAWGKLYKADIIIENDISFVDTKIIGTEDALFNLYVFKYVKKAVYINKCFNHYRKNNYGSLTKTYKVALKEQWENLYSYMYQYVEENDCDHSFYVVLNNRICLSIIGLGMNILRGDKGLNKIDAVKDIIASKKYRNASKQLTMKYFPLHWKVFFYLAKYNCAFGVYYLLVCIKKLKER